MTTSWQPPAWAKPPPQAHQWHLDELKNGNIVCTHSLNSLLSTPNNSNRNCITFGRINDPTQIDILTAHESCSRLHARLAFTQSGIAYLKDLGSGNGTFVNNRRLPPEACGKEECTSSSRGVERRGSRGVVVYPGDAIRFGCSTRIFVLEGPEEFERNVLNTKKIEEVQSENDVDNDDKVAAANNKEEEVCNWGISAAECTDDDDMQQIHPQQSLQSNQQHANLPSIETFFSTPSSSKYTIPTSLQQLYNQYQTKSYKLDSISTESARISQKEDMGVELTDGQRNQLVKNTEKMSALEVTLKGLKERIEEGMCVVIYGKPLDRKSRGGGEYDDRNGGDYDDVDDFYDRTTSASKRQRHDDGGDGEAESEASLVQKWKVLIQSHSKQQDVVSSTMKQCTNLQRQIDNTQDDEEVFFLQNDLNLVKDNAKKATLRLEEIEQDLKDVERLLKIVNPKLCWDRERGLVGVDLKGDMEKSEENVSSATDHKVNEEQSETNMMMPPPSEAAAATISSAASMDMPPPPAIVTKATEASAVTSLDIMPPPPKVTTSAPESAQGVKEEERASKKKRQLGPMRPPATAIGPQGTLAALQQFASHPDTSTNDSRDVKKQKTSNDNSSFDPRKDEWNAPADQDGSGRTSLHDKFKGRY